jgi:hypothetical protein
MSADMKKKNAKTSKILLKVLIEQSGINLAAVRTRGGNDRRACVAGNEQRENAGDAGRRRGR